MLLTARGALRFRFRFLQALFQVDEATAFSVGAFIVDGYVRWPVGHVPHFNSVPLGATNSWSFAFLSADGQQSSRGGFVVRDMWYGDKQPFRMKVPKGTAGSAVVAGYSCTRA